MPCIPLQWNTTPATVGIGSMRLSILRRTLGRRRDIDALRGLAICLVVAGHLGFGQLGMSWLGDVIYSFHIPLFVFVSGYVLWRPRADSARSWIARRFQGLVIPYLAWTALYWCLAWLTTGTMPPLSRLWLSLLTPWGGATSPWFLYSLFMCCLLVTPFRQSPKALLYSALIVALLPHMGILPWTNAISSIDPRSIALGAGGIFGWKDVLWLYPFLAGGFLASAYSSQLAARKKPILVVSFVAAPVLLIAVWPISSGFAAMAPWLHSITDSHMPSLANYLLVLLRYPLALSFIAILFFLTPTLGTTAEKALAFLGVNSLGIYCAHILLLGHSGHGIGSGPLLWVTGFAFVLFGSLAVTLVIARIPYVRYLFLGRRTSGNQKPLGSAPL